MVLRSGQPTGRLSAGFTRVDICGDAPVHLGAKRATDSR
jgi:hypothetical protein